ncbi:MAG: hypothetical protein HY262_08135 [Chloroflexi bacterium]|nr:hypothetical protein [Chloroflexota bacterium]
MATETDAARDRVLASRAALGEELDALEASVRAAVDIPAKVRRSPAKAAAVAGSAGFLVLGGPGRLFRRARRAVFGPTAGLPRSMLPKEIEKTLRQLGDDGDKVRGAIERDFADYAKRAAKENPPVTALLATSVARPMIRRGIKAAGEWFLRTDDEGFSARLAEVRERAAEEVARRRANGGDAPPGPTPPTTADEPGPAGA